MKKVQITIHDTLGNLEIFKNSCKDLNIQFINTTLFHDDSIEGEIINSKLITICIDCDYQLFHLGILYGANMSIFNENN